jgi:glycyl-tRNA synthetase beta chain
LRTPQPSLGNKGESRTEELEARSYELPERLIRMSDFLLEIGLEEVPARMIAAAEAELGKRMSDLLRRERLLGPEGKIATYSTPRRLAVLARGVFPKQSDAEKVSTGPSWKVAFKDGLPTAAAEAFAKKAGIAVADLKRVETPRGEYVGATVRQAGRTAAGILMAEAPKEVLAVYWAKNMYWRAGKPERFVRPVRWVVAMLDAEVVPLEIAGITAGNTSRGHRVLHGEAPVQVSSADAYQETLRAAHVVADVAERRQIIRKALDAATRTVNGARWREDEPLVDTVTHLTEWPTVILGDFEPEYLELPEEVLVTVMRDHQKYFAVEGPEGKSELQMGLAPYCRKLLPHFLAVLNTQVDSEGEAIIRHGNERVLRARFKDARFFWDVDQKTPLVDRVENLKHVTFHRELGDYFEKTEQDLAVVKALVAALPRTEMDQPGTAKGAIVDEQSLTLATRLAKADLTTELVKEFTELQGIIGGRYALAQGLSGVVAHAISDQYKPSSTEDAIPSTVEGQLLGVADRIQTIVAMFGIGNAPTGSKDPFALRRAANGIVKILAESQLPLTLSDVVGAGVQVFNKLGRAGGEPDLSKAVGAATGFDPDGSETSSFLRERLQFFLKDVRGFAYDVVNAVLAAGSDDVRDAIARAEALTSVRGSDDFLAVSAAFKRIKNILRQAEDKGYHPSQPNLSQLALEAIDLWDRSKELAPQIASLRDQRAYREALGQIATLRPTVDAFFDKVMVLDQDETVRGSNLGLIDRVLTNFSTIADFSEIVTG